MRKTFSFGKVAYCGDRKINAVEVEIELRQTDKGPVFTASGTIWNSKHTDCICGGQCLDTIAETSVGNNKTFKEIYRLWKLYHLNDCHAGDAEQEKAVKEYLKTHYYDYTKVCEYLDSIGLLVHNGYRYGSGWLYEAIPEEDLKIIKELL